MAVLDKVMGTVGHIFSGTAMDKTISILTPLFTIIFVAFFIKAVRWLFFKRNSELTGNQVISRQIVFIALNIAGLLAIIFSLPICESSRNQLISLIGVVISGLIAFSSTNTISSLISGMVLRATRPFKAGDFIRVADYFGRVSWRGWFDTEIQTETRELITLPHNFLISNPVTTVRSCGTIVSATISLAYNVHHKDVELLLIKAAEKCQLEEPFMHILEIGNFAVTYRISGLLKEVKLLITARSNFHKAILDALHEQNIEIISPNILFSREIPDGERMIPHKRILKKSLRQNTKAEEIVFDKAEQAEEREKTKENLLAEMEKLAIEITESKDPETKHGIEEQIKTLRAQLKTIEEK